MQRLDAFPTLAELHDLRKSLLARLEPATASLQIARRCGAPSAQRYALGARVQQLAMMLSEVEAALGIDV
jgi:hypothetical protein